MENGPKTRRVSANSEIQEDYYEPRRDQAVVSAKPSEIEYEFERYDSLNARFEKLSSNLTNKISKVLKGESPCEDGSGESSPQTSLAQSANELNYMYRQLLNNLENIVDRIDL